MKKQLRKEIINKRLALSKDDIHIKSQEILKHVKSLDLNMYQTIMIFMDFRQEVETKPIIEYLLKENKDIVLPKVDMTSKKMTLHKVKDLKDLVLSSYGILEPKNSNHVNISDIDYIFVPGVAFNQEGMRLGYGGGFYDRFLKDKNKTTPTVALVFEFQLMCEVPHESHDMTVEAILTEKGYRSF